MNIISKSATEIMFNTEGPGEKVGGIFTVHSVYFHIVDHEYVLLFQIEEP